MRLILARVILPRVVRRTKMSKSEISLRDIRPDYHEKEVGLDDKGKRRPNALFLDAS